MGKMKVLKVAQMPCHNLGRAGIVAEVVRSAPRREGAPGITHQEVPNQLRRDAHRLFPQRKLLGHSTNELVPLFQNYMWKICWQKKIPHRSSVNFYHWQKPIL